MLDPNQVVCGKGIRRLRSAGIEVDLFPVKFMAQVEDQNREFIRHQETLAIEEVRINTNGVKTSPTSFAVFAEEAEYLIRCYRRLHFDDSQNTRLPLDHASWPNFNPATVWTYTQIQLCCLRERFTYMRELAIKALQQSDYSGPVELFNLTNSVVMVDLLPAIQDFRDLMMSLNKKERGE